MSGQPSAVFLITFVVPAHPEVPKILGIYESEEAARAAIERAKTHPSVGDNDNLFWIDEYDLGKDEWLPWPKPDPKSTE